MKIVVAHNAYQQRGGEDAVVEAEIALLRHHGHEVLSYTRHNDELTAPDTSRLRAAAESLWSRRTRSEVALLLQREQPDILHVHNSFPLISPSLVWAAYAAKVPVVQTLHNFRLLCPQAMLLRQGRVCESCVGRAPWPAVVHACYRGSRAQTGVVAAMLLLHRSLGTWQRKVARYIALNDFCRDKFIEGGLPAERIAVKPNFVDLPPPPPGRRHGLLFVGRLSAEKGVATLAAAAATLPPGSLRVAGSGPAAAMLQGLPAVQLLGALSAEQVAAEMCAAIALVLPSLWYENLPRTLVEAYACGLPVLASRLGALQALVQDGVTGLHVAAGDAADLAASMHRALAQPERLAAMGAEARAVYEREYTADANHAQLLRIYADAKAQRRAEDTP